MTRFNDTIESGNGYLTESLSSRASVALTRARRFSGGGNQTWTGFFPSNTQCVDVDLYILANGSAATSDRFTLTTSAGATTLATITGVGSAQGFLTHTQAGLGTVSVVASACYQVGPTDYNEVEVPFQVILSSLDTATDYGLLITFRRALTPLT